MGIYDRCKAPFAVPPIINNHTQRWCGVTTVVGIKMSMCSSLIGLVRHLLGVWIVLSVCGPAIQDRLSSDSAMGGFGGKNGVGLVSVGAYTKPRKVTITYPIEWIGSLSDSHFTSSNVTANTLTCFGNEDFAPPTYAQGFVCFIQSYVPFVDITRMWDYDCNSIWGSRSVIVETVGSIEFFKLPRIPKSLRSINILDSAHTPVTLKVSRWLDHAALYQHTENREAKLIPAEPIYLCARSTAWDSKLSVSKDGQVTPSRFNVQFRSGHIRDNDRRKCSHSVIVHIMLLIAFSNVYLLPYIISPVVAVYMYLHGLKIVLICCAISGSIVCLAPIMLKAKNRHLAGHYLAYFLPGVKEEATIHVIRKRLPVFQAVFFSSAAVCIGSAGAYVLYSYFGIDRELRNIITRVTLGFSSSWLVFLFCRSFERFLRDWIWVLMSVGLAQMLMSHLNPLCHQELIVATIAFTFLVKTVIQRVAESGALDVKDVVLFLYGTNYDSMGSDSRHSPRKLKAIAAGTDGTNNTSSPPGSGFSRNRSADAYSDHHSADHVGSSHDSGDRIGASGDNIDGDEYNADDYDEDDDDAKSTKIYLRTVESLEDLMDEGGEGHPTKEKHLD
jgi:hypothetical protein